MTLTIENNNSNRLSLNGDISLIKEEDSREITTLYDQADEAEKEVLKYSLMFSNNNETASVVNSPMQFKPFDNFRIPYEDLDTNSRMTSTNSQFSDNRKTSVGSSARNSYSSYNYETNDNDSTKPLNMPKLRSPFKSSERCNELDTNIVNAKPAQKKRNRSLRWSYQGQIETINQVQKQNAMIETENKLFANENINTSEDDSSKDEPIYLKPIHKRTASLPYGSSLKLDTLSGTSTPQMISLKRRISPSTFFKSGSEDREGKIKQQQQKIKDLELENLKQFSQLQELISQTSYCIKEIEVLKQTSKPKRRSIFSFRNILYFFIFSFMLGLFMYEITTDSSSIFNNDKSLKHTYTMPTLDFPQESLWYTAKKQQSLSFMDFLNEKTEYLKSYISK